MNDKLKIIAILPVYNESGIFPQVIIEVKKYVDQVIVVDDGSEDDLKIDPEEQNAVVLRHLFNLGQGAALQTGFEYAKRIGADVVVTFDADGQFEPAEIPSVTRPILDGEADIVLGSRFLGKTVGMPLSKHIVLKLAILFTRLFSGVKLTDVHNGFRAFNRKALEYIRITQNRMAHASEIVDEIIKHELSFAEVPVTVRYDDYSINKGQDYSHSLAILRDLMFQRLFR